MAYGSNHTLSSRGCLYGNIYPERERERIMMTVVDGSWETCRGRVWLLGGTKRDVTYYPYSSTYQGPFYLCFRHQMDSF